MFEVEARQWRLLAVLLVLFFTQTQRARTEILTPPYFNLAEGRKIHASATCGEDTEGPELFCKLVGPTNAENDVNVNVIQGQHCDVCDPSRPDKSHPPEFAVDGTENWWQSPPLSRGMKYQEVNLTIDLGQEFHVAYVYVRMGNSPRPGLWILEKSVDYGKTFTPWQYFSDSTSDCIEYFGRESTQPITKDDSVICNTDHSRIVPLERGEIPISLLNNRPSANHYFNSSILQEWTRATNVRLRLLRTKNLYGHLMSVARQDPTVTRRYFYSIKDISIGGRCMCNGHADTCDNRDPTDPSILVCLCRHNTCGPKCDKCCPGFEQKAWRQSKQSALFVCEPCNCFNHSNECIYDPEVDRKRESLDIHGKFEGGGVCQNCQHNTEGTNCNRCKPGFYRPYTKSWNETDVCQPCDCHDIFYTGNCGEGSGHCECRKEYQSPNCDSCSFGYYGYPNCKECDCFLNGTQGLQCEAIDGLCPCKSNYGGDNCGICASEYYGFPICQSCECNPLGSVDGTCDKDSGNCTCKNNYGGKQCDECQDGYFNYPSCPYCDCDVKGTKPGICNKTTGKCDCKEGYGGDRCDKCTSGYFGYPDCRVCNCSLIGSASPYCDPIGKCPCLSNFAGRTCEQCSPGYYKYPECLACNCDTHGSNGITCNDEGICQCHHNFDGVYCDSCKEGFYNFPACEDCNCNPAGVITAFAGCGSVPKGELCQCKDRVEGRICDSCKPLYWNLNMLNPEGCEECHCHIPGVLGGIRVCNNDHGQCTCKPSVVARGCSECDDGTFNLQEDNLFGCTDCGCDVGGAVGPVCDKHSGQCQCQPRVTGRTCKEPLQLHYFPTLYQFQYELEDARTQDSDVIRNSFNEDDFPNYSWKGFALFSPLQREIIKDIEIYKPSLYRMVLRYVNKNPFTVTGTIKIIPENPNDIEQKYPVQFKNSSVPAFVTIASGNAPIPLVLNPGKWTIHILVDKNLFMDYFVLLPEEYYMASVLNQRVEGPCTINGEGLCREFSYPNVSNYDASLGAGGYINLESGGVGSLTEYYEDFEHLSKLGVRNKIPILGNGQKEIEYNITLSKPGRYILLINYVTPIDKHNVTHDVDVIVSTGEDERYTRYDNIKLYNCPYTTMCRQVVIDSNGIVSVYNAKENMIHAKLKGDDTIIGIQSIVAIPYSEWSLDFVQPRPICIRKDGSCLKSEFPTPPESKKIQFEKEAIASEGQEKAVVKTSNDTSYIFLHPHNKMVDVRSKVPTPGLYTFIVHYYQPEFPEYDVSVLIQNGLFYEAKLPVRHCPAKSGCRWIISQKDGNNKFSLMENFMITFELTENKNVYLDYLLVVPSDLYTQRILEEEGLDRTGEFIANCGNNHFYIDANEEGFCKESVFSITSAYNNGALPCSCDFDGSTSFECKPFGGQCSCKEHVIGRQCSLCETDYYGFPDCKPCNCPSPSRCEPSTGECICPPNVIGERCDQCKPFTYGFDPANPLSGCEDCKCDNLGVVGTLDCDLYNGSCSCKENVVGRKCNMCKPGHFAFPFCDECECDITGTITDICDQQTAECFCKKFVKGAACDICEDGTYNLQETNDVGCTECFCFGKTNRCHSSNLYRVTITDMRNWDAVFINDTEKLEIEPSNLTLHRVNPHSFGIDMGENANNKTAYFAAPPSYLGKRLTIYGAYLRYTVFYTTGDYGKATRKPDVILEGSNTYLLYYDIEHPASAEDYISNLEIVESSFTLPSGMAARREHLMMVLKDLRGIYIRASYWSITKTTRLTNVELDEAIKFDGTSSYITASSVEECDCPPNYQGLSCEECAPGYYRTQGPHGGYCVACNCNGHAEECDVNTGICINCQHNTVGDHCEECAVGYHGNAMQGTPKDCLICACPLPITSNNFAKGCEVSSDGDKIRCECNEGYFGLRCQSCAAGFYGRPEKQGDYCRPCKCSGNINPNDMGSCDTVTGECLKCLNNTFGESCALCKPGYFGDAVELKDCQTCVCSEQGTERCNSYTGECVCRENVIGDKCDMCKVHHYGYQFGRGCRPCSCGEASISLQCDDSSGQCRCKPGVTGRQCDRCAPGYWNYTIDGCVSCGCKSEYSLGFGCNANTGQCECLPGVLGDKCDHCPYRWAFDPDNGCFACDSCTDDLLDFTDHLAALIDPVQKEFDAIDSGYFTTRRLTHINDTIRQLKPLVKLLDPDRVNLTPIMKELDAMEQESSNMNRKANYSLDNSKNLVNEANKIRGHSAQMLEDAKDAADDASNTIDDIEELSSHLIEGEGPKLDTAVKQAQELLTQIKAYNFTERDDAASDKLDEVLDLLNELKTFKKPFDTVNNNMKSIKKDLKDFNTKLDDLTNQTLYSLSKTSQAKELYDVNGKDRLEKKLSNINTQTDEIEKTIKDSQVLLQNATRDLKLLGEIFKYLNDHMHMLEEDNTNLSANLKSDMEKLTLISDGLPEVQNHAEDLSRRAEELDNLLNETRNSSENAVRAATAYNEIIKAINEAEKAAQKSKDVAEKTVRQLNSMENDTLEADSAASDLLSEAFQASHNVSDIIPRLEDAKRKIRSLENNNEDQLKTIQKFFDNYQSEPIEKILKNAKDNADNSQEYTKETMVDLDNGFNMIENRTKSAKELHKKLYDANSDINQVKNQLDTVNEKLPKLIEAMNKLPPRQFQDKEQGDDLRSKINKLRQQIAVARDYANRIDVGVKFVPGTSIELRNPDNLPDLSTSTQLSGYFKTDKPNGLLMYLGNGKETNLRRTKTDDYMALQIENGYPVLTMDIGNGPERIVNPKYVSDNQWYQFVIDRTGLNAKLSIKEQLADGREKEITEEQQLEGPYSIFNLDKNQSKLFVGSYPDNFKMQDTVQQSTFEGDIEGLVIGENPVSLWNFNWGYENNHGAYQRDKLRNIQSTGYRFNGNGYAILNSRSYPFRSRSDIHLSFKTFATEGLLFLYGKGKTFIALELRNGKVLYKYNLGSGTKVWHTTRAYNDGAWHTVEASRDGANGRFIVDNEDIADTSGPIKGSVIEPDDTIFFGGYPQMHDIKEVTNIDFDGCIDNVVIMSNQVDLSMNVKAYGVTPGCPVKFSRLVSFYPNRAGYIKKDKISTSNDFKINLKFKTKEKDGLIFYATDKNQEAGMSLSLQDGHLKLISQKTVLVSSDHTFNDSEWHVVSVRHNNEVLRMDFDDYGYITDDSPKPLHILYGDIFIGGVPVNYNIKKGMVDVYKPFSGCIGDATVNGNIVNFANSTDKYGEVVGKCIMDKAIGSDSDVHSVPVLPPLHELDSYTTAGPDIVTDGYDEGEFPKRGDGGRDGGDEDIDENEVEVEAELPYEEGEDHYETTTKQVIYLRQPSTTTQVPSLCALPMEPEIDEQVIRSGSYRYGTEKDSRIEFKASRGKYRRQFEFSLEFKTLSRDGVLFYVADPMHTHFVALFMKAGFLHFMFDGGHGAADIKSEITTDDNVWHTVHFSREASQGKLVIDDQYVTDGKTPAPTTKIDIQPPYYLGGTPSTIHNHVLGNLNITDSFKGCIKNLHMNNKPMENPEEFGVIPCSEHVEPGVFFGLGGGYVKLKERFKVGVELDVKMEIKPRNLSGLIMAVHGKRDYFVMELDNGALKFTVDNGMGPITTRYQPSMPHSFCDGQWHKIQAVKSKSVVTLAVNGVYSDPGVGDHRSATTNTGGFLFLGGHRLINRAKGLTVRIPYIGCIRNVQLNNQNVTITPAMAEGQVTIGSCPTN